MALRVAHLSDIHFFHLNKNPLQFFSKRFLANFNALFTRRINFNSNLAYEVLPFLKKLGVTHLIISGDYTSSSSNQEFEMMNRYVKTIKNEGFELFTLPGNHDAYTNKAHRNQLFFSYLDGLVNFTGDTKHNLINDHVAAYKLKNPWWLVLLNCSCSTPWHKSIGVFSKDVEKSLLSVLKSLPEEAEITLACHYPFELFKFPRAHLEEGARLESIIMNDKRIRLYLHGHRHSHRIEQIGPITVADSGSISLKKASSFNLLTFSNNECEVSHYKYNNNSWSPTDVRKTITPLV